MTQSHAIVTNLKAVVAARAAQDDAFRVELLANPKAAVEKLLGSALPAHVKVQAIEEAPDTYVVAVPARLAVGAAGELSDDDLEAVAGGSKSQAERDLLKIGSALATPGLALGVGLVGGANAIGGDEEAAANTAKILPGLLEGCGL